MKMDLQVGFAQQAITPTQPLRMLGYGSRTAPFDGVHDDLYCQAVALKSEEECVLILALDLCWMDLPEVDLLNNAVCEATGIRPEQQIISFTHTHAGPMVAHFAGYSPEEAYVYQVVQHCVISAEEALDDLTPARMTVAEAKANIGCNRRERTADDRIILGVNPQGAHLDAVTCWRFERPTTDDVLLFTHPMHGTTLGGENLLISAEWMGIARSRIEEIWRGTRAVYLQGCGADQNPYRQERTIEQMKAHGETVAKAVTGIRDWRQVSTVPLCFQSFMMNLPTMDGATSPCPLGSFRLGDCVLMGLGGEAFVEYALYARSLVSSPEAIMMLGYCNGSVGYLPTGAAYEEGGYETESFHLFNIGKSWSPDLEGVIKAHIWETLQDLLNCR